MLTQDDIKKLKEAFATKKDLERFATKKDLERFATKLELSKLEVDMNLGFDKIREEMATKDEFRQVMTILDKVLKEVLAMRQDQDIHTQKHRDIDEEIEAIKQSVFA